MFQSPHNVVRYQLRGDANDLDIFMVDDESGAVMLRRSVYTSEINNQQNTYTVCFQ